MNMSKLDEASGYLEDLATGNVLPVYGRNTIAEIEKQNQELLKKGQKHLIRFKVVDKPKPVNLKTAKAKKED